MQGRSTDGADCPGSGRGERGERVYRPTALPPGEASWRVVPPV